MRSANTCYRFISFCWPCSSLQYFQFIQYKMMKGARVLTRSSFFHSIALLISLLPPSRCSQLLLSTSLILLPPHHPGLQQWGQRWLRASFPTQRCTKDIRVLFLRAFFFSFFTNNCVRLQVLIQMALSFIYTEVRVPSLARPQNNVQNEVEWKMFQESLPTQRRHMGVDLSWTFDFSRLWDGKRRK